MEKQTKPCVVQHAAASRTAPDSFLSIANGYAFLNQGRVHALPRQAQVFHVLSGCAWVTFAGQDFVVPCGERLVLRVGDDLAVISALGEEPMVYELQ